MQKFLGVGGILMMILVGASLRLIPHPVNFSPIGAMALFGGAAFAARRSSSFTLLLPLVTLLLSDLVLGFHDTMPAVYFAFLMVGMIGTFVKSKPGSILCGSLAGSFTFFGITNYAVWAQSGMYSQSLAGLTQCFVQALPFLQNQILGDLVYSAVLFGAWAVIEKKVPALRISQPVGKF